MDRLARMDQLMIAVLAALFVFPVQYAFRGLDDNTLTNWQWIFRQDRMVPAFLFLSAIALLAPVPARFEPDPRRYPLILGLASVIAVLPLWGEPEAILDAGRYFSQAKYLELHGITSFLREWGREVAPWTDLPLVPFVYGVLFRALGETRIAVQCFTTLLFCVTALSTYRIGRALWNAETGFFAGLLLLASPYLLVQVPLMLVDVPVMALVTLSLDAFLSAVRTGGITPCMRAALLIVLAMAAKFSAWPMLVVLPVAAVVAMLCEERAAGRRAAVVLGVAAALCGLLIAAKYEVIAGQLRMLREYQLPGLGRWRESSLSTLFFQVHPFVTLLAAWGAVRSLWTRDIRILVPFWSVLFATALQVERIRYLLPLFPLFVLMAAYGLHALSGDGHVRRAVAYGTAGASLVLALFAYLPFLNSTTMANLRDAGCYLDSLPGAAVEVHVLPQHRSLGNTAASVPLLDLFTEKRIVLRYASQERPDDEKVRSSPLRFTWEASQPAWYAGTSGDDALPRILISSGDDVVPDGVDVRRFAKDTGTFRYRTVVTVLERRALAKKAQSGSPAVPF